MALTQIKTARKGHLGAAGNLGNIGDALKDAGVKAVTANAKFTGRGRGIVEDFFLIAINRTVSIHPQQRDENDHPVKVPKVIPALKRGSHIIKAERTIQVPVDDTTRSVQVTIHKVAHQQSAAMYIDSVAVGYIICTNNPDNPWEPVSFDGSMGHRSPMFKAVFKNRNGQTIQIPASMRLRWGDLNQVAGIVSNLMAEARKVHAGKVIMGNGMTLAKFIEAKVEENFQVGAFLDADTKLDLVFRKRAGAEQGDVLMKDEFGALKVVGQMGLRQVGPNLVSNWSETDAPDNMPRAQMINIAIEQVHKHLPEESLEISKRMYAEYIQHQEEEAEEEVANT